MDTTIDMIIAIWNGIERVLIVVSLVAIALSVIKIAVTMEFMLKQFFINSIFNGKDK